jgi:hypothetical protein
VGPFEHDLCQPLFDKINVCAWAGMRGQVNGCVVMARFSYLDFNADHQTVYSPEATETIYAINVIITLLWCFEAAARMIAYGFAWPYVGSFWSKAENRLDFAITITGCG